MLRDFALGENCSKGLLNADVVDGLDKCFIKVAENLLSKEGQITQTYTILKGLFYLCFKKIKDSFLYRDDLLVLYTHFENRTMLMTILMRNIFRSSKSFCCVFNFLALRPSSAIDRQSAIALLFFKYAASWFFLFTSSKRWFSSRPNIDGIDLQRNHTTFFVLSLRRF